MTMNGKDEDGEQPKDDGTGVPPNDQPKKKDGAGVPPDEQPADEEAHLAREHGLIRMSAYIPDPGKGKSRSSDAKRTAKLRAKDAANGIVLAKVPVEYAAAFKEEGGFADWLAKHDAEVAEKQAKVVEKQVVVREKLSQNEYRWLHIGKQITFLNRVERRIVSWLLGFDV
ncbi:hypothetical protein E4K72_10490 [Oxalobacteraceae bacterium OM1]|nr:hypothetical protein E4K72_10490 [Oxalobacteraceae bacterium OM1]